MLKFKLDLEYTPRSPKQGLPFTESSHLRSASSYEFNTKEIGIALVDLWNFGWDDGPLVTSLGWELSTERGVSHAIRKKEIMTNRIAPAISELRQLGVQIFHCNHAPFLNSFPQWLNSTTEEERRKLESPGNQCVDVKVANNVFPEKEWQQEWSSRHSNDVYHTDWSNLQIETYSQIQIPQVVQPQEQDLLVYSKEQFHRILTEHNIRVLFYMGFETDECITQSDYGIINMHSYGYMTNIVRDCTTTYESAETVEGLWRTKVAIEQIEKRWGYSINAYDLLRGIKSSDR
ncbi:hypothetical protein [Candidatus Pristimantibacillus sp. PTI5]|uniref:hypothetical protein n=1 Tax=Candidatus Pristimantibacillus sp. PTI5 TaxID=3400422 RepID=UPI003B01ADAF